MTPSAQLTQAASAKRTDRASSSVRSGLAALQFVIFEDNGGSHHFRIVAGDGATLALAGDFASYDRAGQAAPNVPDGAASARFDRHTGEPPAGDPATHPDRPSTDRDAERRQDEDSSFSSNAGTR